ncbi:hypothetical protein JHJ32_16535 [Parapedobacter sp. ISTM3]|uniref:hypothetical protein n=1 Tax=Parapedobacter sp. ISTM3 TaxID=2800130 RepID=UPI001906CEFF|nr:hypothetical protein [Parapedobacter sp. ISTM3]MBK1441608.1 hypothetical protein [Parapedobacter sp. ISTM3]
MESYDNTTVPDPKLMDKDNLKSFYKEQLPSLLKTVFLNPISGTFELFKNPQKGAYNNSILLLLSTMALYLVVPYLLAGKYIREMLSLGVLLKISISSGVFILVISALAFGIKSISGKPIFKNELLVGALCGIGLVLVLVSFVFVRVFSGNIDLFDMMDPSRLLSKLRLLLVFTLYIFLFMVNIFQQSLKASGTKDAISWYISPLAILLAFYVWGKITTAFLKPDMSPF